VYVISDELGDELRDAQRMISWALQGEERLRRLSERYCRPAPAVKLRPSSRVASRVGIEELAEIGGGYAAV
jgi:hypothetical protein